MIDQGTAAATLFPNLPATIHDVKPSTAVIAPPPAPAQSVAKIETLNEQNDRLDRTFALGRYAPGPDGKTPAEVEAQTAAAKATDAGPPEWLDKAGPDFAVAAPALASLGIQLSREQAATLEGLHHKLAAAAVERQADAWATEAEAHLASAPGDLSDANNGLKVWGSPELVAALKQTGMVNNVHLVRALAKAWRSNPLNSIRRAASGR